MTIALAWVGARPGGRPHLYMASDSRVRGGQYQDTCPKIFTLPRSDCAMCFAGDTASTYPMIIQVANAIGAHEPAVDRQLDISRVKDHILKVFTDFVSKIENAVETPTQHDFQFLFGGYSWLKKEFLIWTIYYDEDKRRFLARPAKSFHERLPKAAFIGDWARHTRAALAKQLNLASASSPVFLEPLKVLANSLKNAKQTDTIGGAPQLLRIAEHMNTRPFCVKWNGEDTLFGRPLFDYENVDYWIVDPCSGEISSPRKFGNRD